MSSKKKHQAILLSALFAACQIAPAPMAVAAPAAAPAAATDPAAAGSGPIDIQAHEQEFSGDHVIAKGNVKVNYKDTLITAPLATLYRDQASGQPQKAIFTGHPWLTQGANKIDADQLVFEMTTSKIFAEGHAHSEVVNNDPTPVSTKKSGAMPKGAGGMAGKGNFEWPTQESDKKKAKAQKAAEEADNQSGDSEPAGKENQTKNSTGDESASADGAPAEGDKSAAASKGPLAGGTAPGAGASEAPTKIVTDSNKQEYDRDSGRFEAFGNVKVIAGDITVTADHLKLAYGLDHRPEAAVFDGHVNALQGKNNTASDFMTYFLNTKRLQASGHVRSKVIQEKNEAKPVPKKQEEGVIKSISHVTTPDTTPKSKHSIMAIDGLTNSESKAPIIIVADSQDYNKETGRLDAIGNAKIFYEDTVGIGPKVVLLKNADGQAEKILFIGRSQVTQKGKRWIGDRVTIMVADRRIIAEGNTKAVFLQKNNQQQQQPGTPGLIYMATPKKAPVMATKPPSAKTSTEAQLADPQNKISASKVNRPE